MTLPIFTKKIATFSVTDFYSSDCTVHNARFGSIEILDPHHNSPRVPESETSSYIYNI